MLSSEHDDIKSRVRALDKEVAKSIRSGYVTKTTMIRLADVSGETSGVEMFLDIRVTSNQIRHIVDYIVKSYNLDAVFYTKSHSIKVWYRNAR